MAPKSAYVHIPFCVSKCLYCDFNSQAGTEHLHEPYVKAVIQEICSHKPKNLETIYLGGGTPTVLSSDSLADILSNLPHRPTAEVTVEANPSSATLAKLSDLRKVGFNRLSMGVQSFDDCLLKIMGRIHTADEAVTAYQNAREAGFDNISIDLIFALPQQTIDIWRRTLEKALELNPEHISLYELSIEEGTPFFNMGIVAADEDLRIDMYLAAIDTLTANGYTHYEVSSFSKPSFESRHNRVYWENKPYYGFGAGATEYIPDPSSQMSGRRRAKKISSVESYIKNIKSPIESSEIITGRQHIAESIGLGLRLLRGIDLEAFEADILADYKPEVEKLLKNNLIVVENGYMRVTDRGLLLLNDVIIEFM